MSAPSFFIHRVAPSSYDRGFSPLLQEVGWHKPSLPRVPQDAADRAARWVAAEEKKKKKDAEKARAHERMRARDALEKLCRRQEREGLPREPSPETPEDDDDDQCENDVHLALRQRRRGRARDRARGRAALLMAATC